MGHQRFDRMRDAIKDRPPLQAASMRARSELMSALQQWVKAEGVTQATAAGFFGVSQPRVSNLMRGRIDLFSTDTLIDMATIAGLSPHVSIKVVTGARNVLCQQAQEGPEQQYYSLAASGKAGCVGFASLLRPGQTTNSN